jgi:hypothetical protein
MPVEDVNKHKCALPDRSEVNPDIPFQKR